MGRSHDKVILQTKSFDTLCFFIYVFSRQKCTFLCCWMCSFFLSFFVYWSCTVAYCMDQRSHEGNTEDENNGYVVFK